jgi:hypothetical protein
LFAVQLERLVLGAEMNNDIFNDFTDSTVSVESATAPTDPTTSFGVWSLETATERSHNGFLDVPDNFKGTTHRVPIAEIEKAARATGYVRIRVFAGFPAGMKLDHLNQLLTDAGVTVSSGTLREIEREAAEYRAAKQRK